MGLTMLAIREEEVAAFRRRIDSDSWMLRGGNQVYHGYRSPWHLLQNLNSG